MELPDDILLPGSTFEHWTVLARIAGARYLVQCDCGTIATHYRSSLVLGKTLSCGCLRASRTPNVGDTLGEWTILARESGSRRALVRCSCGVERSVEIYTLGKDSKSCGHELRKTHHDDPALKVCTGCGEPRYLSDFHQDSGSVDGRRPRCKACVATYHQMNREHRNEKIRNIYKADPAKKIAATTKYRKEHPEYGLVRERIARGGGTWVGDITAEAVSTLLEEHHNSCYICERLLTLDTVHWDHFQPIAKGGDHSLANLRPSCRKCNNIKSAIWPINEEVLSGIKMRSLGKSP